MSNVIKELYFSIDIEADDKIPGRGSMVALGAVVAGYRTSDGEIVKLDPATPQNGFYAEIRPISDEWNDTALAIGGFTREYIMKHGEAPEISMTNFVKWVNSQISYHNAEPIFIAFPLGYDWMWTYWYMEMFTEDGSPFGHGRHADVKTLYAAKANALFSQSGKSRIPQELHSSLPHTHNARDDAAEQGELFMNILLWKNDDEKAGN